MSAQQKYDLLLKGGHPGISFAAIARPQSGAWPTYDGLSGNRFSPLDQINPTTIYSLAPKWMFTIQGAPRTLQMTPVVVDGAMYVTSVNEAYALDARTGRAIWHYSRPRTQGLAAYRASTGERVWRFWTVPAPVSPGRRRGLAARSSTDAPRPG